MRRAAPRFLLEAVFGYTSWHQAGPFELQAPVRRSHPSSFWIDCSRLEGLSMVTGKVKCLLMNIGFKMKEMMQKMPFDQNCEGLYFILDRQKRQWYKCCRQFTPVFKCIEVQPTAWYSQRSEFGVSMPFDHEDVQMCFREKQSPDQNCPLLYCNNVKENCLTVGELGKDASWLVPPKPKGKLSMLDKIKGFLAGMHMPDVQVIHLGMPEPLLILPNAPGHFAPRGATFRRRKVPEVRHSRKAGFL
ncbi:unnamed protein product [Durusdinium trenchii]|uniref:Uncharacterized protein n=1 Tax=Durusdinium trenchii TaxID=1381693 RepID=A0ABP0LSQ3_9DINO